MAGLEGVHCNRAPVVKRAHIDRDSPSTSDVGDGNNPPHVLHEHNSSHTERGGQGDIEPPVTVQIGRVAIIQSNPLTGRRGGGEGREGGREGERR